jgi:hypothetical protein
MTATARIWHPPLAFEIADYMISPPAAQLMISSRHPKRAAPFKRGDRGDLSRRPVCTTQLGAGGAKKRVAGCSPNGPWLSNQKHVLF